MPDFQDDHRFFTTEETEKQLRELMGNSMNQDVAASIDLEEDAIVPGFREGIKLLPHQIVGRAWMKDRETGKKAGGILADDMGCVQHRIVQSIQRANLEFQSRQDYPDAGSHSRGKGAQIRQGGWLEWQHLVSSFETKHLDRRDECSLPC
jgi:hypothetical protein